MGILIICICLKGSLIESSSRYRAVRRPRHGSLCLEPQNSCLQMVFWVFVGGSMALCSCTHTSVVQPRCVYTHLGGLPKLDTLRFWPGYMFTLASCKYIFLGRWYVYTHLGSYHIYTYLVLRPRYVYTHFGSSDVGVCGCGGLVFRSSPQGPRTPPRGPKTPPEPSGTPRIMIFWF